MIHIDEFMFATGIENSYPVITKNGHDFRRDEMRSCHHYERWKEDFDLVREMGISYLRYGPPIYSTYTGAARYDWDFADETFQALHRLKIQPIVDLCHFGVPDWIGDFQNPDFPRLLAEYASAFAERFPWVRFYTPVNEIRICASNSALMGWWNERLKSDSAFVTAIKHMTKATILAEEAILSVRPDALFVQSEATSFFHPSSPESRERSYEHNQVRFLPLDLCYGHDVSAWCYEYILGNGFSRDEYHWCREHGRALLANCIMGNDYYSTNETFMDPEGKTSDPGEVFGYYAITGQFYERYKLPVMYTETNNLGGHDARRWLRKEWANMVQLKEAEVPLVGFTWYSLTDQIDWDTALREDNGTVNAVGLFDLQRKIRPVGTDYKKLIAQWSKLMNVLPR